MAAGNARQAERKETPMAQWFMVTVVGEDRTGIVSHLTQALFEGGANLGEASMLRLGGNFTIMLMTQFDGSAEALDQLIGPVVESMGLRRHVDPIQGHLHQHASADVRVTVYGADRAGIVAQVTGALAEAGLHILELESDVIGSAAKPVYVMVIEGRASQGVDALRAALDAVADPNVDAQIESIDTMLG